jgi:23S rRNA (pseudouridine1915-N3)-methyltransferase
VSIHCHIIAIGKNKDAGLQRLIDEYIKRLSWKITFTELAAPNVSDAERKSREADLLRATIPEKAIRIVLDERGENPDSIKFANKLQQFFLSQHSTFAFVIGGADGLDETFRKEAHLAISFGAMTWPHMMVRLMLVEQLYRASTILSGHPYHRV